MVLDEDPYNVSSLLFQADYKFETLFITQESWDQLQVDFTKKNTSNRCYSSKGLQLEIKRM
ncbi:hypothetical protein KSP40_PGU007898 [Platanthera guangdongensis]|uniref:Uncharacterized protein n=1 Tax=Platanthera guangdongensis TaxID=2320717 RepID=A0ABR2M028_9ASPA